MPGFASGVLEGMQGLQQIEQSKAYTGLTRVETEERQMQLQQQKQYLEQMRKMESSNATPMDPAERLDRLGQLQIEAGLTQQGARTLEAGSQLRFRNAQIAATNARKTNSDAAVAQRKSVLFGNLMGGVTDQVSWDRANALYTVQTGERSPYANTPYSPELVGQLRQSAMTAYQTAELQRQRANDAALEQYRKARLHQQQTIEAQRQKDREAVRSNRAAGGGPAKDKILPPPQLVKLASSKIAENYVILSGDEANVMAEKLAEDVIRIKNQNPGLNTSEALAQAYLFRMQSGDYNAYTPVRKHGSKTEQAPVPALPPGFELEK